MGKFKKKLKKGLKKALPVAISAGAGAAVGAFVSASLGKAILTTSMTMGLSSVQASLTCPTSTVVVGYNSGIEKKMQQLTNPPIILGPSPVPRLMSISSCVRVELKDWNLDTKHGLKVIQLHQTLDDSEKQVAQCLSPLLKTETIKFVQTKRWPKSPVLTVSTIWKFPLDKQIDSGLFSGMKMRDFINCMDQWVLEPLSEMNNRAFVASLYSKCAQGKHGEAVDQAIFWGFWTGMASWAPKLTQKLSILFSLLSSDPLQ